MMMEGEDKLLSQEASGERKAMNDKNTQRILSETDCRGLDAPSLIRDDITAGEENVAQKPGKNQIKELQNSTQDMEVPDISKTAPIDLKFVIENHTPAEQNTNVGAENDKECDGNGCLKNDEKSRLDNERQSESSDRVMENGKPRDNEEKKDDNLSRKIVKNGGKEISESRDNIDKQAKSITTDASSFVEVQLNDGNNNSDPKANSEKRLKEEERVRRARFSSEISIEPKAYFQAGSDAVITLPPKSPAEDVFQNETNHISQSPSPVSSVILNVTPSDHRYPPKPPTFLPLTLFTCLFCCPMIGLFAAYKSYSVKKFNSEGEFSKAREASQQARQLGILGIVIGFFFVLAIIVIALLVAILT